jgi:hypothetical protein
MLMQRNRLVSSFEGAVVCLVSKDNMACCFVLTFIFFSRRLYEFSRNKQKLTFRARKSRPP